MVMLIAPETLISRPLQPEEAFDLSFTLVGVPVEGFNLSNHN